MQNMHPKHTFATTGSERQGRFCMTKTLLAIPHNTPQPFCPASYFDSLGVLNEDSLKGMMSIISLKRSAILSP